MTQEIIRPKNQRTAEARTPRSLISTNGGKTIQIQEDTKVRVPWSARFLISPEGVCRENINIHVGKDYRHLFAKAKQQEWLAAARGSRPSKKR
jgi:hypothetical protein